MCNFGDISYATGEQVFEGSSAPTVGTQLTSALPGDNGPSHDPSCTSSTAAPLSSSTRCSAATSSLTVVAVHDSQKAADNDDDYDLNSNNDLPESVHPPNLTKPMLSANLPLLARSMSTMSTSAASSATSTSHSQTTPTTVSSHVGPVCPPGPNMRSEPYSRWPADQHRSMSSRSNSDRSKASGKLSETAMIMMVGNDIHYAVDQLQTSAVTAFTKPVHIGTIIQENHNGFPDSIILQLCRFSVRSRMLERQRCMRLCSHSITVILCFRSFDEQVFL